MQAARELLDRGYGKVPEPAAEPPPQIMEGIVIEPFRKSNGNGSDEQLCTHSTFRICAFTSN